MANTISRGDLFPPTLVQEMFNAVKGRSSVARLAPENAIPFNGAREMVFNLDGEASIVGENDPKVNGGGTVTAKTIIPVKFEYGLRVSDEFLYGSEEYRMDVLRTFADGFSRKIARGFDIASMHGLNPKTMQPSAVVGDNHFDAQVTNTVTYDATTPDTNIDSAIALINAASADPNGIAMSPALRNALASMKANGVKLYPEFNFGANPDRIGAMAIDVNSTVSAGAVDEAIIGDFSGFRWGYAKEMPLEVIEYGNPDNDAEAGDLKGHNQVYLRTEAYIGWSILAPQYFALIKTGTSTEGQTEGE